MPVNSELCREIAKLAEWSDDHNQCGYIAPRWETMTELEKADWHQNGIVITSVMKEGECGTQACIAGFTAIKHAPEGTRYDSGYLFFPDGTQDTIERWAGAQLGLNFWQRQAIFFCFDNQAAINRLYYLADNPNANAEQLHTIGGEDA